jgi:hypothetical protein
MKTLQAQDLEKIRIDAKLNQMEATNEMRYLIAGLRSDSDGTKMRPSRWLSEDNKAIFYNNEGQWIYENGQAVPYDGKSKSGTGKQGGVLQMPGQKLGSGSELAALVEQINNAKKGVPAAKPAAIPQPVQPTPATVTKPAALPPIAKMSTGGGMVTKKAKMVMSGKEYQLNLSNENANFLDQQIAILDKQMAAKKISMAKRDQTLLSLIKQLGG